MMCGMLGLTSIELGLGPSVPLSAAKPTRLKALDECEIIEYAVPSVRSLADSSIGASAFFTIFIVTNPGQSIQNLPLWPEEIASAATCAVCFEYRELPDPIMCEKVRSLP